MGLHRNAYCSFCMSVCCGKYCICYAPGFAYKSIMTLHFTAAYHVVGFVLPADKRDILVRQDLTMNYFLLKYVKKRYNA